MTPFGAGAELLAQHDALREMMDRCEQLADALDADRGDPADLARELARLREAFEAHNRFEEALLRPVLVAADPYAGIRLDRMIEDHVQEHAQLRARLGSPATRDLRDVIETLRAHLAAEERYLLTSKALRAPGGGNAGSAHSAQQTD